ncbi:hypothetical protein TUMEXPCC7403_12450 [Tumidithrix helvetica PCC 7403]|uniref:tetratricopeptide repeat protein n=1 Tax=Tumidithrix helvetica TaxID=3457545 RepID=UPI003C8852AF
MNLTDSKALFNLSVKLFEQGKYQEAKDALDRAIEIEDSKVIPDSDILKISWERRSEIGTILLPLAEQTVEVNPNDSEAWNRFGEYLEYFGWQLEAYHNQKEERSRAAFERAIHLNPNYYEAWLNLGRAELQDFQHVKSLNSFERAIEIEPNRWQAWIKLGEALERQNQRNEALQAYDRAIAIDPDNYQAWAKKGSLLWRLERQNESIECMDRAFHLSPDDPELWKKRGYAHHRHGSHNGAHFCWDKYLGINFDDADVWREKGYLFMSWDRDEEAIYAFDRAIEIRENDVKAWFSRAITYGNIARFNNDLSKFEEAVRGFEKVLEIDPSNSDACRYKGESLLDLGRYEEARLAFEKAIELQPDIDFYLRSGELELNNYEIALLLSGKKDAIFPKHEIATKRGNSFRALRKYNEALVAYDEAIALSPESPEAWYGKAVTLEQLERLEEALTSIDRALLLMPDTRRFWRQSAIILGRLKRWEAAAISSARVFDIADTEIITSDRDWYDLFEMRMMHIRYLKEIGRHEDIMIFCEKWLEHATEKQEKVRALKEIAEVLVILRRYEEAILAIDKILDSEIEESSQWHQRGCVLWELGRKDESREAFRKALLYRDSDSIQYELDIQRSFFLQKGEKEEADACREKMVSIAPKSEVGWHFHINAFIDLGRYAEALEACDRALEFCQGNQYNVLELRGDALEKLGRYEEAIAAYELTMERTLEEQASKRFGAFRGRISRQCAWMLFYLDRYEEALVYTDRAIAEDPENCCSWNLKTNLLDRLNQDRELIEACKQAIKVEPTCSKLWSNLGFALHKLKRYDEALEPIDRAIELNSDDEYAWNLKGDLFLLLGKLEDALGAYDRVIKLDPNFDGIWKKCGYIFYNLERYQEAFSYLNRALEANSGNKEVWFYRANCLCYLKRYREATIELARLFLFDSNDPPNKHLVYYNIVCCHTLLDIGDNAIANCHPQIKGDALH